MFNIITKDDIGVFPKIIELKIKGSDLKKTCKLIHDVLKGKKYNKSFKEFNESINMLSLSSSEKNPLTNVIPSRRNQRMQ